MRQEGVGKTRGRRETELPHKSGEQALHPVACAATSSACHLTQGGRQSWRTALLTGDAPRSANTPYTMYPLTLAAALEPMTGTAQGSTARTCDSGREDHLPPVTARGLGLVGSNMGSRHDIIKSLASGPVPAVQEGGLAPWGSSASRAGGGSLFLSKALRWKAKHDSVSVWSPTNKEHFVLFSLDRSGSPPSDPSGRQGLSRLPGASDHRGLVPSYTVAPLSSSTTSGEKPCPCTSSSGVKAHPHPPHLDLIPKGFKATSWLR